MFSLEYFSGYRPEEEEFKFTSLINWTILDNNKREIEIKLEFLKPLYVSSGEVPC